MPIEPTLTSMREPGREKDGRLRGDHHGGDVAHLHVAGIDADAHAAEHAADRLRGEKHAFGVAGAGQADDQAVSEERVLAHALDVDQFLHPHRRSECGAMPISIRSETRTKQIFLVTIGQALQGRSGAGRSREAEEKSEGLGWLISVASASFPLPLPVEDKASSSIRTARSSRGSETRSPGRWLWFGQDAAAHELDLRRRRPSSSSRCSPDRCRWGAPRPRCRSAVPRSLDQAQPGGLRRRGCRSAAPCVPPPARWRSGTRCGRSRLRL